MTDLNTKFMGLSFRNPLIAGSSGLTDNKESILNLEKHGIGGIVLKSLFEEEIIIEKQSNLKKMASEVFLYPETVEFYEYDEGPKESTIEYLELIRDIKKNAEIPLIASINCVTAKQWVYFPREIELAGADGIELNLFILPSDLNRTAEENEKIYFHIIDAVLKQVKIPVAVKISYYFSNLAILIKRLSETKISGIVLFNRFYSPDFDIDNFQITQGNVLSSPGDLPISLRWIAIMSERVSCDLAASTGVHDGAALIKQLLAGAKAVQIVSAIYKYGAKHIPKMLEELTNWMEKHQFSSIDQFKGRMSQSKSSDPAAYERVQFMKYFRGYRQNH
jgi:dihydroorotate dehydrogenase (fumarate)